MKQKKYLKKNNIEHCYKNHLIIFSLNSSFGSLYLKKLRFWLLNKLKYKTAPKYFPFCGFGPRSILTMSMHTWTQRV